MSRVQHHQLPLRFFGHALAIFLLGCIPPGLAQGQTLQVTLDPGQTKISISVNDVHGGVHGSFKLKSGSVVFDPKTGDATGAIIVDARSGDTGNSTRDSKMNKDVLESQRYPEIAFSPKRVTGFTIAQGKSNLQVQGVFRIHGADHDLMLTVPIEITGDKMTATTSFVVPYESWGIKNPSVLFLHVDGKAEVSVSAVGKVTTVNSSGEIR